MASDKFSPQESPIGVCAERLKLLDVWNQATARFSNKVSALHNLGSQAVDGEFQKLMTEVESIRLDGETARIALQRHRQEHGC